MNFTPDSKLTFDPIDHKYFYDGVPVPSCTQIIESAGLSNFDKVPYYVLEKAAEFGKYVHSATQFLDNGNLDWKTLDEVFIPYIHAWEQFKKDTGFIIKHNEIKLYSKKYNFAGTLDRFGIINKKEVLPDIKTGINTIAHGPQLAGYEQLCRENGILESRRPARMTVKLKENGTYSIEPYKDRADFAVFCNALQIHKFKNKKR